MPRSWQQVPECWLRLSKQQRNLVFSGAVALGVLIVCVAILGAAWAGQDTQHTPHVSSARLLFDRSAAAAVNCDYQSALRSAVIQSCSCSAAVCNTYPCSCTAVRHKLSAVVAPLSLQCSPALPSCLSVMQLMAATDSKYCSWSDLYLPKGIRPNKYMLHVRSTLQAPYTVNGQVDIQLKASEATPCVVLHAHGMDIQAVELLVYKQGSDLHKQHPASIQGEPKQPAAAA